MPANGELARLAERKALLEARIAVRRIECELSGAQVAQPLAIVMRLLEQLRNFGRSAGAAAPTRRP